MSDFINNPALVEHYKARGETYCGWCNTVYESILIPHVCVEHHGKLHECLRCGLYFECKNPDTCTAEFKVLPNIIVNGEVVEHCPLQPDWNWIREYGYHREIQLHFMEGKPTEAYGRCLLRDKTVWRCHKDKDHKGACSCHNDCGARSEDRVFCGFPPDHCGHHSWEVSRGLH